MKTIIQIGSAVGLALTLGGCGTLYKLDVAAYSTTGESPGNTYVILSADPDMSINSPEFELHANQLERALGSKGFQRVPGDELDKAALGIYVSANISDPSKVFHTVSRPVYDPGANEDLGSAAKSLGEGNRRSSQAGGSEGFENKLPPAPKERLEGIEENSFATTVYTKQLNLVAVDLQRYLNDIRSLGRSEASPIEVWSVDIESTGQPSDLAAVIPIMIAAAQPYIADETGDVIRVKLTETDQRVSRIKGE